MPLPRLLSRIYRRAGTSWKSWRWKLAQRWRQTMTLATMQGRLTISCKDGFISRALFFDREYELALASQVLALLRGQGLLVPGRGTVLDLGANLGVIGIGMLHRGEFRRAIAIEPEPRNYALLQHNVRQNGLQDRVLCLPYAVSDLPGTVAFELCGVNFGDHRVRLDRRVTQVPAERFGESGRRVIDVQAARLDDVLATLPAEFVQDIHLVWMDTQGHEAHVLRGGHRLFARGVPVVAEIWPYGLKRAGVSQEQFCALVRQYWSDYWMVRRGKLVRYPVGVLGCLFDELGDEDDGHNVLLTR
jgi:FkbM family methyltransferase